MPKEMNGFFVRTGPNPYFPPRGRYHWFDGDGMWHVVNIVNGVVNYCNEFIETPKLIIEKERGYPVFPSLLAYENGFISGVQFIVDQIREKTGVFPKLDFNKAHQANTNIISWAGKRFALIEADMPFEVVLGEGGKIESVGYDDLKGTLDHGFTAHPKVT